MTACMNRFAASRSASANCAEASFACENTSLLLMGAAAAASIIISRVIGIAILALGVIALLVRGASDRPKDMKQLS